MAKKVKDKSLVDKYKLHPEDTGSASVQIVLLSERITYLTEHLKQHKKDFHTRRGLLMLVSRRRRLLNYLKNKDLHSYTEVAKGLDLIK